MVRVKMRRVRSSSSAWACTADGAWSKFLAKTTLAIAPGPGRAVVLVPVALHAPEELDEIRGERGGCRPPPRMRGGVATD